MSASTVAPPTPHRATGEIVPLRRPWRWVPAALVPAAAPAFAWSAVTNEQFQWAVVAQHFTAEAVLRGLGLTLWLTALTVVLGFVIGGEVPAVIRDLAADGMTMVVVTHEIGFARSVADHVVFLDEGLVVESGPPGDVLDRPAHRRTREFLARVR